MLEGKTGNLYLDRINQVHRQLVWVEMREGVPEVLGYSPRMYPEEEGFQEVPAVEVATPSSQNTTQAPASEELPASAPQGAE
jgi:hypothetical protein